MTMFDRITLTPGIRFGPVKVERRKNFRVPLRMPASAFPLIGTRLGEPVRVMVRDVSRTGVAVLVRAAVHVPSDWVVTLGDSVATGTTTTVLRCRTRRQVKLDSLSRIVGAEFVSILAPGQQLRVGDSVEQQVWVPCGRETPEDPVEMESSSAF